MDEQKTQTSAQPEHIPLLLIARELWRKLGLILMFAATVAACGYIAAASSPARPLSFAMRTAPELLAGATGTAGRHSTSSATSPRSCLACSL